MSRYSSASFPPGDILETPVILRELVQAHRGLAELKGLALTIPNQRLLVSTLSLQEAQSSSEIENIITTQDSLFKYPLQPESSDAASKEVAHYVQGLDIGIQKMQPHGLLTLNTVLSVQQTLLGNNAGFRKVPGTVLKDQRSGKVVFEPPSPELIPGLMDELEAFIHADSELDPLVRMALIHHQFESIHPFYDGNGRTGRIINILFLIKEGLLDTPILYLSRYISQTKADYYHGLQAVRDDNEWQPWLLYMLRGVALTARHTSQLVSDIRELLQHHKQRIRGSFKFYSQDLLNNIFWYPYTKATFLAQDMNVSRATSVRYLDRLAAAGILHKYRLGRENYYINHALFNLLANPAPIADIE